MIDIYVYPPQPIIDNLKSQGRDVPFCHTKALLDTGAYDSAIEASILEGELNLIFRNVEDIQTSMGERL